MTPHPGPARAAAPPVPLRRWLWVPVSYLLLLALGLGTVRQSNPAYWAVGGTLVAVSLAAIWSSQLPRHAFGITLRGAHASLRSALVSTALLGAGGLTLVAFLGPDSAPVARDGPRLLAPELLLYASLAAPLQELVFRGVVQGGARHLLAGRRGAGRWAVLCSTAAYAASHLPWGVTTALVMVVPGVVWGVQFERDRTLAGVMVSHIVIGYLFVGATPLWRLLTGG